MTRNGAKNAEREDAKGANVKTRNQDPSSPEDLPFA
jgi:hypothetical protein